MAPGEKLALRANGSLLKVLAGSIVLGILVFPAIAPTMTGDVQAQGITNNTQNDIYRARMNDSYSIGVQAYIYGLAPVIIERIERNFTTTPGPAHAPVNQFGHIRHLATPNDTLIPTPNSDTLYSTAWLELGDEPIILHVPDTHGRYYVMQMLDAYTNSFASVGRRTTGTDEGDFAIVGPGWNGSIPVGVKVIKSPTNTAWIIGRILVNGTGDLANATALQDQLKLTPLGQYENTATSNLSQNLSHFRKYAASPNVPDRLKFFEDLRVALKNNPPPAGEGALMAMFGRIGLGNNETPYASGLYPAVADGLARSARDGDQIVKAAWANAREQTINGWTMALDIGTYGYDYLKRAVVAEGGLGANVPEEAVYAKAQTDGDGKTLNGTHRYVMRFANGSIPPVDAFWSLTIYNATTYTLVANPIDRYAIGDRTQGLKFNSDGSLDIYIQRDRPAEKGSNWLPAPERDFYLVLRMYQPKAEVLSGTYQIPAVMEIKE